MPPEKLGALRCPKCGNDLATGGEFHYVEAIEAARRIRRVKDGYLLVNSWYETDGYDEGKNPQFECQHYDGLGHTCGHRWPVPDWVLPQVEWV